MSNRTNRTLCRLPRHRLHRPATYRRLHRHLYHVQRFLFARRHPRNQCLRRLSGHLAPPWRPLQSARVLPPPRPGASSLRLSRCRPRHSVQMLRHDAPPARGRRLVGTRTLIWSPTFHNVSDFYLPWSFYFDIIFVIFYCFYIGLLISLYLDFRVTINLGGDRELLPVPILLQILDGPCRRMT